MRSVWNPHTQLSVVRSLRPPVGLSGIGPTSLAAGSRNAEFAPHSGLRRIESAHKVSRVKVRRFLQRDIAMEPWHTTTFVLPALLTVWASWAVCADRRWSWAVDGPLRRTVHVAKAAVDIDFVDSGFAGLRPDLT